MQDIKWWQYMFFIGPATFLILYRVFSSIQAYKTADILFRTVFGGDKLTRNTFLFHVCAEELSLRVSRTLQEKNTWESLAA